MKKIVFFMTVATLISCCTSAFSQKTDKKDSISRVYSLGNVEIIESKPTKILTGKISSAQLQEFGRTNLTDALNLLPGLSISEASARNEGSFYLRGFNILETPVYYDGIPIYVPYDGNVDLSRFMTFDLSQITVTKALTSVLYGPNTLGGAVNMVSRKPVEKFELEGISGIKYSDDGLNGYNSAINIGSKTDKFYYMGSVSYLKNQFTSLSDKFTAGTNEDGGKRENSATKDLKVSAKVGYTPNKTDEYSLNMIVQKARKGIPPPITGSMFRSYPKYDKTSIYFRSYTAFSPVIFLKSTAFYDSYYNIMDQFDSSTYTLQNTKKAFHSIYDDYTLGGSLNLGTTCIDKNKLTLSLYEKFDSHKEHNGSIAANSTTGQVAVTGEPIQTYLDNTISSGVEDIYNLNDKIDVIAGASYSYRGNNLAQEYGTQYLTGEKNVLYNFPSGSNSAFNYQLAGVFKLAENQNLKISASRKSRFASQKERYSSKFGSQIPNPDLKSEFAWIFDATYSGQIKSVFEYEVSVYRNNMDNAIYQITEGKQDDGTAIYQNQNVGKAVFEGYEVSLGYKPVKEISVGANYSYIYCENKEDKSVKYVGSPNHKLIAYGKFRLPSVDAGLHVDVEVNSKRYVTSDGETLPGYMLTNATLYANVWKGVSIESGVTNLFDRNYCLSVNYPREGRTFMTSVIYNF